MTRRPVGDTELLLCSSCGLGVVPELGSRPDFWETGAEEELEHHYWTAARAQMFERALNQLGDPGPAGRLLDLGGGVGYFAECALRRGWDAYSSDVSASARAAASRRIGEDRSLTAAQARERVGQFDVVTMWCVIAHVVDPVELLRSAVELLRPGGRILLTTPNFVFQGALARLLARVNKHYDLVSRDHVLHFTPTALDRLLEKGGLESCRYEFLGVTEYCCVSPRFAPLLVPLKRLWNYAGSRAARLGLPAVGSELQVVGAKPAQPAAGEG